jgi:two-component system, LytTR family, sensor kinase
MIPVYGLKRYPWLISVAFWQFSASIFILHRYFTNLVDQVDVNWLGYIASMEALHVSLTLVSVPLFHHLSKKNPSTIGGWILYSIAIALIVSLLTTILFAIAIILSPSHLGYEVAELPARIQRMLVSAPLISWIVSVIILMTFNAVKFIRSYEEQLLKESQLKEELAKSQLQMLRMQVNPHFLFNSFNTISMMIRAGRSEDANNMIAQVSELFRASLLKNSEQMVMLSDEVAFCEQYLRIEGIRFSDRLNIEIKIDPSIAHRKVPAYILQPLIENAFKHGLMDNLDQVQELHIYGSTTSNNSLILEVRNTGRLLFPTFIKEGIGLRNIKERLQLQYGGEASLRLKEENGWVVARIKIQS